MEGCPVMRLDISRTPNRKRMEAIAKRVREHLTELRVRYVFIVRHVRSDTLDVVDIPAIMHILSLFEDDIRNCISGALIQATDLNSIVVAAKTLFLNMNRGLLFDIVVRDEDVSQFLGRIKHSTTG